MEGICIVCGEILAKYDTILQHILEPKHEVVHAKYERKVIDSVFKEPCFCGGKLISTGVYPDSWQVVCEKCEYIWAED